MGPVNPTPGPTPPPAAPTPPSPTSLFGLLALNDELLASEAVAESLNPFEPGRPRLSIAAYHNRVVSAINQQDAQELINNILNMITMRGIRLNQILLANKLRETLLAAIFYDQLEDEIFDLINVKSDLNEIKSAINTINNRITGQYENWINDVRDAAADYNPLANTFNTAQNEFSAAQTALFNAWFFGQDTTAAEATYNQERSQWFTARQNWNLERNDYNDDRSTYVTRRNTANSTSTGHIGWYNNEVDEFNAEIVTHNAILEQANALGEELNNSGLSDQTIEDFEPIPPAEHADNLDGAPPHVGFPPQFNSAPPNAAQMLAQLDAQTFTFYPVVTVATISNASLPDFPSTVSTDAADYDLRSRKGSEFIKEQFINPILKLLSDSARLNEILTGDIAFNEFDAQLLIAFARSTTFDGFPLPDSNSGEETSSGGSITLLTLRADSGFNPFFDELTSGSLQDLLQNQFGVSLSPLIADTFELLSLEFNQKVLESAAVAQPFLADLLLNRGPTQPNITALAALGLLSGVQSLLANGTLSTSILGLIENDPNLSTLSALNRELLANILLNVVTVTLTNLALAILGETLDLDQLLSQFAGAAAVAQLAEEQEISEEKAAEILNAIIADIRSNDELKTSAQRLAALRADLARFEAEFLAELIADIIEDSIEAREETAELLRQEAIRRSLIIELEFRGFDVAEATRIAREVLSDERAEDGVGLRSAIISVLRTEVDPEEADRIADLIASLAGDPKTVINPLNTPFFTPILTPTALANTLEGTILGVLPTRANEEGKSDFAAGLVGQLIGNPNSLINLFNDRVANSRQLGDERFSDVTLEGWRGRQAIHTDLGEFLGELINPANLLITLASAINQGSAIGPQVSGAAVDIPVGRPIDAV